MHYQHDDTGFCMQSTTHNLLLPLRLLRNEGSPGSRPYDGRYDPGAPAPLLRLV